MASNLKSFVEDRLGANFINNPQERYVPGMLLETDWNSRLFGLYHDDPEFLREDGFAWDLLGIPEDNYGRIMVDSNMVQYSINEKRSIGGDANSESFGIVIDSGFAKEIKGVFKVSGMKAQVFKDSGSAFVLYKMLLDQKEANPDLWDWINDSMFITESIHVTSLTVTFDRWGDFSAKAAFEKGDIGVSGEVNANWLSDEKLEIVGAISVPIGIRGLKV